MLKTIKISLFDNDYFALKLLYRQVILCLSLLAFIACGMFVPSDDDLNADDLRYKSFPLKYYIDQDFPEEYREAVQQAAAEWNNLSKRELFRFIDYRQFKWDDYPVNRDNPHKNVIHASDKKDFAAEPEADVKSQALARAAVRRGKGNKIVDCDIYLFNFTTNFVVGRHDYQGRTVSVKELLMHEFGHCLGFTHSADSADIMHGSYRAHKQAVGWDYVGLSAGDIKRFFQRYPELRNY